MKNLSFCSLPLEVLDNIFSKMAESQAALSVIKLSMTCRLLRKAAEENLDVWYRLYLYWRGPIRTQRTYKTQRGVVTLRPTYPVSVPNFRTKTPPIT